MKETITELLKEKRIPELYHLFEEMAPADIAEQLKRFEDEKLPVLYRAAAQGHCG